MRALNNLYSRHLSMVFPGEWVPVLEPHTPLVSTSWQQWAIPVHYSQTGPWQTPWSLAVFSDAFEWVQTLDTDLTLLRSSATSGHCHSIGQPFEKQVFSYELLGCCNLRLEIVGKTKETGKQHEVNVTTTCCSDPPTAFQAHLPPKWASSVY